MKDRFKKDISNYFKSAERYEQARLHSKDTSKKDCGCHNFPDEFTRTDQYKDMMQNKKKTDKQVKKCPKFTPMQLSLLLKTYDSSDMTQEYFSQVKMYL